MGDENTKPQGYKHKSDYPGYTDGFSSWLHFFNHLFCLLYNIHKDRMRAEKSAKIYGENYIKILYFLKKCGILTY